MELIALEVQIQALHHVATTVNARGDLLVDRLQDIPNRARQIATHGVRQGLQLLWLWCKPVASTIFSFWSLYYLKKKGEQASTILLCNLM